MKIEPVCARGSNVARSVRVTLDETDALALATILSFATNAYDQDESVATRARSIFNRLAAACEHLNSDARCFTEEQTQGTSPDYYRARKLLDPGYEVPS